METMRDAFFNRLFEYARRDPAIMVLTSDFSAPSFDRYRTELPGQFVNVGISEQNAILVATGLAISGMKVFVVSIAPFITMRCFEQIRLFPADMNLDITIVGVGAGLSYIEAGATHHSIEDIGLMRLLPNMRIWSPSSNSQMYAAVERRVRDKGPAYVRMDRRSLPELYPGIAEFGKSMTVLRPKADVVLLSTGFMTHEALATSDQLGNEGFAVGVVDVFSLPMDKGEFEICLNQVSLVISMEEHVAAGGLGDAARCMLAQTELSARLVSSAIDNAHGLCHSYGARDVMHKRHGLDTSAIAETVRSHYRGEIYSATI